MENGKRVGLVRAGWFGKSRMAVSLSSMGILPVSGCLPPGGTGILPVAGCLPHVARASCPCLAACPQVARASCPWLAACPQVARASCPCLVAWRIRCPRYATGTDINPMGETPMLHWESPDMGKMPMPHRRRPCHKDRPSCRTWARCPCHIEPPSIGRSAPSLNSRLRRRRIDSSNWE